MKPDDFEARLKAANEEAETLEATISTASVDERSSDTLKRAMRSRMADHISKITQDLETEARKEEEETIKYSALEGGKEVWIYFWLKKTGETGYGATLMMKEFGPSVAADMREKRFVGNPAMAGAKVWYMRHMSFVKAIEGLKQDILDAKYDERLGTDAAKLIFDALKDKAG